MALRPELIVFDVDETLSDLAPLRARGESVGARRSGMRTAFLARNHEEYPTYVAPPQRVCTSLLDLARALTKG